MVPQPKQTTDYPTLEVGSKDVTMALTGRRFPLEFRSEAAHRVIDTGRGVRPVVSEFSIEENMLSGWACEDLRCMEASEDNRDDSLSPAE